MFRKPGIVISIITYCLLFSQTVKGDDHRYEQPSDYVSPSEIHRMLWEGKVSAKLQKEAVRKLITNDSKDNTQTNYNVTYYDVAIRINDTTEIIYGSVHLHATSAAMSVGAVQVDLYNNMIVDSIVNQTGTLFYLHEDNMIEITLDRLYLLDESFDFVIYYHGHPTEGGFQAFSFDERNGYKVISSLSEPYFARTWWPCKDRMDDKPDSMGIAITTDTAYYVASNGTLDSVVNVAANAHTYYYSVHYPIVTYLFSVAVSVYTVWYDEWVYNGGNDTLPLVHAVYPDRYGYSLEKYGITPYALGVLSDKFGPYPYPEEKYGHANFEWGGGMEHQTMTSMSGADFGYSEPVVVHEMGHQWWGDMITCESWADIWLNEGWASYTEALYWEEKYGNPNYRNYMAGMVFTGGGTIIVEDTTSVWNIFHSGLSYDKAAWVVHMLRGVLGDSLFFVGVDAYYNSVHQYGSATTEDFKNVFESATGQELDYFFEQWIYGEYMPNYEWSYMQQQNDSGWFDTYIYIKQKQIVPPLVFTMPIKCPVDYQTVPDDTIRIFNDEKEHLITMVLPDSILNMQFDPHDWILKYAQQVDFGLMILTENEDLSNGEQYTTYADTLSTIGGDGSYGYMIMNGALPPGLSLGLDGIISGAPTDTGSYSFTVYVQDGFGKASGEKNLSIHIGEGEGRPGDFDMDDKTNVVDLTALIEYLFAGGSSPVNPNLADVNSDCKINVVDLTIMVEYLFGSGGLLLIGCVQ